MKDQKYNPELPEWLEQQQHHSWQIEILLASGAVLFLSQVPGYLRDYLLDVYHVLGRKLRSEFVIGVLGGWLFSRALLIGFILNLALRAIWVAFLGVNYSFPGGVDFTKLNYSGVFNTREGTRGNGPVRRILILEKACTLSFSFAIFITLMAIGGFVLLLALFKLLDRWVPAWSGPGVGLVVTAIIFSFVLGLFDHLFFGVLGRFRLLGRLYYPIHRLLGLLTLKRLYRQEWLTINSNLNRWLVLAIFAGYFSLAFFWSTAELKRSIPLPYMPGFEQWDIRLLGNFSDTFQSVDAEQYDDMLQPGDRIVKASLGSSVIRNNYFSLFVVYREMFDEVLGVYWGGNGATTRPDSLQDHYTSTWLKNDRLLEAGIDSFLTVRIDGQSPGPLEWYLHEHPKTGELGFLTHIPSDSLSTGPHRLWIYLKVPYEGKLIDGRYDIIPFIKD